MSNFKLFKFYINNKINMKEFNLIEIGFGDDKSRPKENPNLKIYNKGNIIISRPKSTKNPYKILSIKEFKSLEEERPKKDQQNPKPNQNPKRN